MVWSCQSREHLKKRISLFRFAAEMLGSDETEAGAGKLLQARTGKVSSEFVHHSCEEKKRKGI